MEHQPWCNRWQVWGQQFVPDISVLHCSGYKWPSSRFPFDDLTSDQWMLSVFGLVDIDWYYVFLKLIQFLLQCSCSSTYVPYSFHVWWWWRHASQWFLSLGCREILRCWMVFGKCRLLVSWGYVRCSVHLREPHFTCICSTHKLVGYSHHSFPSWQLYYYYSMVPVSRVSSWQWNDFLSKDYFDILNVSNETLPKELGKRAALCCMYFPLSLSCLKTYYLRYHTYLTLTSHQVVEHCRK